MSHSQLFKFSSLLSNHIEACITVDNHSNFSEQYTPLLCLCEIDTQKKYISSVIESAVKRIGVTLSADIHTIIISPGVLFSAESRSNGPQGLHSDRCLQTYFNHAVSVQPCVLIIEELSKVFPHESSTRYQNNSPLYETHAKVS